MKVYKVHVITEGHERLTAVHNCILFLNFVHDKVCNAETVDARSSYGHTPNPDGSGVHHRSHFACHLYHIPQ